MKIESLTKASLLITGNRMYVSLEQSSGQVLNVMEFS